MKTIQLSVLALLCAFLLAPTTQAAAAANFSGEWTYNESKSNVGEDRGGRAATKIVVTQDASSIAIERTSSGRDGQTRTNKEELTLDGKVVKTESQRGTSSSTAVISGNSLTIKSDVVMSRQGQSMEMKTTETWELSEDGKTLTIESSSTSSRGDRTTTLVYDKK